MVSTLTTRQLAGVLYSMGRTFDNLSSTFLATSEFLETGNPKVLGSRQDLALLEDLRDAARYTVEHDYSHGIDGAYVRGINAHLTRTAAIEPGVLRTSANIYVHTKLGDYNPGVPDPHEFDAIIRRTSEGSRTVEEACALFARLAKMQPFGDGNKRTALLAANGLLAAGGQGRALIVPTVDPDRTTFNNLLAAWYVEGDGRIVGWLAAFNGTYRALDDDGRPVAAA